MQLTDNQNNIASKVLSEVQMVMKKCPKTDSTRENYLQEMCVLDRIVDKHCLSKRTLKYIHIIL